MTEEELIKKAYNNQGGNFDELEAKLATSKEGHEAVSKWYLSALEQNNELRLKIKDLEAQISTHDAYTTMLNETIDSYKAKLAEAEINLKTSERSSNAYVRLMEPEVAKLKRKLKVALEALETIANEESTNHVATAINALVKISEGN